MLILKNKLKVFFISIIFYQLLLLLLLLFSCITAKSQSAATGQDTILQEESESNIIENPGSSNQPDFFEQENINTAAEEKKNRENRAVEAEMPEKAGEPVIPEEKTELPDAQNNQQVEFKSLLNNKNQIIDKDDVKKQEINKTRDNKDLSKKDQKQSVIKNDHLKQESEVNSLNNIILSKNKDIEEKILYNQKKESVNSNLENKKNTNVKIPQIKIAKEYEEEENAVRILDAKAKGEEEELVMGWPFDEQTCSHLPSGVGVRSGWF